MLLDNKKNNVIKSHIKIFKTYKELKKLLPYSYIKTRVSKGHKFSFKNSPILMDLEKEKKEKKIRTKITKNLVHNKIIYIFSDEDKNIQKIISRLKNNYLQHKNINSFSVKRKSNIVNRNNSNLISKCNSNVISQSNSINNIDSNTSRKTNKINNYIINGNNINIKNKNKKNLKALSFQQSKKNLNSTKDTFEIFLNDGENNINFINNENKNKFELYNTKTGKKFFRSSSISNYFMKNNVFLPSLIYRLKNKSPRNERQNNGFILKGIGINNLKKLNTNNNYENNIFGKFNDEKTYNGFDYIKSYINNDDNKYNNNVMSKKKEHKNTLYKKKLKIDESIITNFKIIKIKSKQ